MESGILMIVIVVIGVFYPVYTAWISLVAAPVYLKIGFLFAMAGALLVMRILQERKADKMDSSDRHSGGICLESV